jgi:hypothetical protein
MIAVIVGGGIPATKRPFGRDNGAQGTSQQHSNDN